MQIVAPIFSHITLKNVTPTLCTVYGQLMRVLAVLRSASFHSSCLSDVFNPIAVHYVVPRICDSGVPGLPQSDSRKLCAADGRSCGQLATKSKRQAGRLGGSQRTDACWAGDRTATRNHRSNQSQCLSVHRQRSSVLDQWQLDHSMTIAQLVNQPADPAADGYAQAE